MAAEGMHRARPFCLRLQAQGVELFEDHICKFVSYGEYLVGVWTRKSASACHACGNETVPLPHSLVMRHAGVFREHAAGCGHLQVHRP